MNSLLLAVCVIAAALPASALTAKDYLHRPKLVVTLVIDQFRADYLTRFEKEFRPAGTAAVPGGFRFLMEQGAWFPFAEYDVLQSMTCPGHAMILTGSHPASTGIATNDWFDPATKKLVYCVDDAEFGASPRRLRTTTVGDELKSVHKGARVITVSLKDRSAIMLGGHNADLALWMEPKPNRWTTSTYYNKGRLPDWAAKLNDGLKANTLDPEAHTVESAVFGIRSTLDAALTAVHAERMGRDKETDLLAVSLSNHDFLGHAFGPNAPEMHTITLEEDRLLSDFLRGLRKELGSLDDVVITFTADHGIPPAVDIAESYHYATGRFDYLAMTKKINERLDKKFGSPGKAGWILGTRLFHYYLNHDSVAARKTTLAAAEDEVRAALLEDPGILNAYTSDDFEHGRFPPGALGQQVKNSYIPGQSGDVVMIAKPFFFEKGVNAVTHMTGWSYDRSVPLVLLGRAFKPGVYTGAHVIDLAPTLSFVLGVLPPAMSEGRVLNETLR